MSFRLQRFKTGNRVDIHFNPFTSIIDATLAGDIAGGTQYREVSVVTNDQMTGIRLLDYIVCSNVGGQININSNLICQSDTFTGDSLDWIGDKTHVDFDVFHHQSSINFNPDNAILNAKIVGISQEVKAMKTDFGDINRIAYTTLKVEFEADFNTVIQMMSSKNSCLVSCDDTDNSGVTHLHNGYQALRDFGGMYNPQIIMAHVSDNKVKQLFKKQTYRLNYRLYG